MLACFRRSSTRPAFSSHTTQVALTLMLLTGGASSARAISSRTHMTLTGVGGADEYGISVGTAGDVNGDGYADVIVGAWANDAAGADAGRAYVYFGGPSADEVADLTLTGAAAGDRFGVSVGTAGDVNGDGYDDVIVGAYLNDGGGGFVDVGRAYVYFGGPGADAVADLTLSGSSAGDQFGVSVGTAGDVNGDGYADMIVGANLNDVGGVDGGRAYVFYGGPSPNASSDLVLTGAAAADFFGYSVGTAGDVNGDGYADVIVGAYQNDAGGADAGRAYVFYGGASPNTVADLTLTGDSASDNFGFSAGMAGDVNGDGFADVIVGAHLDDFGGGDIGKAYVFFGGPGADATADLTVTGAAAGDHLGISVGTAGDANGDGYSDVIAGAYLNDAGGVDAGRAYIYFGGPSADATADITLTGVAGSDRFGYSVGAAGDVDGDGHADLIVGAYLNDAGGANTGRAYVTAIYPYRVLAPNGGEQWVAGEAATVRWLGHDVADLAISYDGGSSWSTLASEVGGMDDNELTVTAPAAATRFAKVRLTYSGQAAKRSTSDGSDGLFTIVLPAQPLAAASRLARAFTGTPGDWLGFSVGTAGDVNGDGYADVIVGAPFNDAGGTNAGRAHVYFGGPSADAVADLTLTGAVVGDGFGFSVGAAGDVNGDGYDDVIVGAGGTNGRAHVYFGGLSPDAVADLILIGSAGAEFGHSVGTAGDVNGDGFADVIVGALGVDNAYVYYGGPGADATADLTLTGASSGDQFGVSVGMAGDVNGDGFADVIVGARLNDTDGTDAGRAYVYYGGPGADATADLTLTGASSGDQFGVSVGTAGDVNGDGFADVVVGAWANDAGGSNAGRAYVYYGGLSPDAVADLTLTGAAASDLFGVSVGTAGDVNRDGYDDVIVGAEDNDTGGTDAGRAYVYHGGPVADAVADLTLTGAAPGDDFGFSVGTAGDVNGDGFDDVIVGAYQNDAGGTDAGRVYLYDCNRYFVQSPNGGETWNVGAARTVSWLGAEPADLWLSVDGGATYDRIEHEVGGAATNAIAVRVPHTPGRFTRVRVTPSDPAVSGSDQSDSLFTIQTSVALLSLAAKLIPERGAELTWSSDPGVGPAGLAGYRLYRLAPGGTGSGARIGPELIAETRYLDAEGGAGSTYRLSAVNGLGEELELGRVKLVEGAAGLRAWPSPLGARAALTVEFAVPRVAGVPATDLDVGIYDIGGRRVATLARGPQAAKDGTASLRWEASRAPGVYFVRVAAPSAGYAAQTRCVVLP